MSSFYGIGVMSGSSLDGIDLCHAEFTGDKDSDVWGYRIDNSVTVQYSRGMMDRLANATNISALELVQLNHDFSHFLGQSLSKFMASKSLQVDFIASHGHTVFHQPDNSLTFCLGDGEIISSYVGCPVISNFRSKNVALGGQGGPLIPNGERFLFQQTDVCLNLGGIANVGSHGEEGFDICPCNSILNFLTSIHDPDATHDVGGALASSGLVIPELLQQLNELEFYQQSGPKSLGSQWIDANVKPLLKPESHSIPDLLRTYVQHVAELTTLACRKMITKGHGTVLATGGGTYNCCLMNVLKEQLSKHHIKIVETEDEIVEYKEALVMAFLGLRTLLGAENVFSNVTGSKTDCVAGAIHHGISATGHKMPSLQDQFNFMIRQKSQEVNELRIIKDK